MRGLPLRERSFPSKAGRPHIVYLSKQAAMLFKELLVLAGDSEWVLPVCGSLIKPFAHNALDNALKVALQGQEIPAFTLHDLRRTASSLLHEKGWGYDIVENALNHAIFQICLSDALCAGRFLLVFQIHLISR
ncbi:tyrosine-type recombinase/integrase [Pseudomonas sp. B3G-3]|nr:tyrosine-type recombinase/integrase [Pseudomonas sp. B3G-3]